MAADLAAFGADAETIERWTQGLQGRRARPLELLPECVPAVELFLACETQWQRAGMSGIPTGLDYAGVAAVAAMLGRRVGRGLFADLRTMENAALAAFLEQARKRGS